MPCHHPLRAYKSIYKKLETHNSVLSFNPNYGLNAQYETIQLPCGQCVGCRIRRSKEWAVRCVHEASQYERNCFLTLTYKPECLPENGTLVKEHIQLFMKRLRKRYCKDENARSNDNYIYKKSNKYFPIRYFCCGEYGDDNGRAHYHLLLFNFDFNDKIHVEQRGKYPLYLSPECEQLWTYGLNRIGSLTVQSAGYVARYIFKKVNGERAAERYVKNINEETGECDMIIPEYITMSRRPGIGKQWHNKFSSDTLKNYLTHEGSTYSIPKYYDKLLRDMDELLFEEVKAERTANVLNLPAWKNEPDRVHANEIITKAKIGELIRSYENES